MRILSDQICIYSAEYLRNSPEEIGNAHLYESMDFEVGQY